VGKKCLAAMECCIRMRIFQSLCYHFSHTQISDCIWTHDSAVWGTECNMSGMNFPNVLAVPWPKRWRHQAEMFSNWYWTFCKFLGTSRLWWMHGTFFFFFFGWCLNFYCTVDEKCIYLNRESYEMNNILWKMK
jgi:hypothetical protein